MRIEACINKWFFHAALVFVLIISKNPCFANVPGGGTGTGPNVTLTDNGSTIKLDNGIVSILINKTNASISQFYYKSQNLFQGGNGGGNFYWSWNMPNFEGLNGTASIVVNPTSNGGDYAEVKIRSPWSGKSTNAAMDVEVYYSLGRGNQGYYAAATLSHPANYPSNPGGEWRCNTYVGSRFNYFCLDSLRSGFQPTLADESTALPVTGAPKEVTLMTTGKLNGKYYCKYSFSADLYDQNVYGWVSETDKLGIWMTMPSHEYYNGGPMKRELTGHMGNTLLNMLGGSHYAMGNNPDMDTLVNRSKTFGPFLVYANSYSGSASDPLTKVVSTLWTDAKNQALAERSAWPYTWFNNSKYVSKTNRGTVKGNVKVVDPLNASASNAGVWVGLAPEDGGTHFQYQQNTYQFWVKTDANGNFTIPNVIPGTYNLWAFGGKNIGEFKKSGVTVTNGQTANLGTITWNLSRISPTIWEIGIPNRDSKEFKNGDFNYTQWQNYIDMPTDYPNGVNYTIGTSDYKKDWNYGLRDANSWNINFNLKEAPFSSSKVSLYLALASNFRTNFDVIVNGTKVKNVVPANPSNAIIRLGSHGAFWDTRIDIPVNLLQKGANSLILQQKGGEIEFDYLRLEADIPNVVLTKSGPTTFCEGGNLTITSSIGKSYRWFNGTTLLTNTTQSLTVASAGTYKVEVTNTNGTKDTSDIVTVVVNPLPVLSPFVKIDAGAWRNDNTPLVCKGGMVSFGPSPTTVAGWSWKGPNSFSSSSRAPILSNTIAAQAGVYTATFTDANGCKASTQYDLTVSVPLAQITTSANSFCSGSNLILTANSGKSYVWFNGTTQIGTLATYTAIAAGNYSVAVTNNDGCKDTSVAKTITVNASPVISITSPANNTTLTSDIFPINATVTGTNTSNVSFYNGTSLLGTDIASPYSITTPSLANGTYTFSAIAKNTSNCTDTAKVTVKVNKVVTGMDENLTETETFSVSPNPFQSHFVVQKIGYFDYAIHDIKGSLVESGKAENNKILGENLHSGVYIITLSGHSNTFKISLIKQ